MSDASARYAADGPDAVRAALAGQGFALTNEEAIGLTQEFRTNFHQEYFKDSTIRHDEGDWPEDRKRARDVIGYKWRDGVLDMWEHGKITIRDRAGIPGEREHRRVEFLADSEAKEMVRMFLSLVPADRREPEGTFGVNLFRTFTSVVTKPHRDNEPFVILYVLDRDGDGATSYLYRPEDAPREVPQDGKPAGNPVLWHRLEPGQILIFDDERFLHGATPLVPPAGQTARRDVVVCTVDDPRTYLAAST